MKTRVLVGVIGVPAIILIILFAPGWLFGAVVGAVAAIAAWELLHCVQPDMPKRMVAYAAVGAFLQDYAASVDWVNTNTADAAQLISQFGIIEAAPVAQKALPYCNIVCITGEEMASKLTGYLQVLFDAQPAAVGGKLPGEDFCYIA